MFQALETRLFTQVKINQPPMSQNLNTTLLTQARINLPHMFKNHTLNRLAKNQPPSQTRSRLFPTQVQARTKVFPTLPKV